MDRGARGPAEPEEADGDEEGADERGLEADFGPEATVVAELRFDVAVVVVEEGEHDGAGADEDAEEGEAFGAEGEAVGVDEDEGEALEPEVEEAVDEGEVEVEEEADGFGEGKGEGPDEYHHADFFARHPFCFDFRLAFHPRVVRQRSDPDSPSVEDVAAARLRQEEEQENEAKPRQPHQLPNRPLPPLVLRRESPNQRTNSRPEHGRDAPHANTVGLFPRLVDIGDGGAAGRERGTADQACEEAEREEHAAVGGVDDGELEEDEGEEGADVDGVAADVRDFGHGCLRGKKDDQHGPRIGCSLAKRAG